MIRGQKFNYYRVLSPKRYIYFMALPYICQGTLQKEGRGDYKKIEITIGNIVTETAEKVSSGYVRAIPLMNLEWLCLPSQDLLKISLVNISSENGKAEKPLIPPSESKDHYLNSLLK